MKTKTELLELLKDLVFEKEVSKGTFQPVINPRVAGEIITELVKRIGDEMGFLSPEHLRQHGIIEEGMERRFWKTEVETDRRKEPHNYIEKQDENPQEYNKKQLFEEMKTFLYGEMEMAGLNKEEPPTHALEEERLKKIAHKMTAGIFLHFSQNKNAIKVL